MTTNKLRLWNEHPTWDDAAKAWDEGAKEAAEKAPIKTLKKMPTMPGITEETARHLKWKSLFWMFSKDKERKIWREYLKHPFLYAWQYLTNLNKKPYTRCDDFFFYGIRDEEEFKTLLHDENSLLIVGFSYCHKPFECPSGRFTDQCIHDAQNPVCRQCFIGKCSNALPQRKTVPLYIPTVHYICGKILDLKKEFPEKQILFLITACEMTLEMFGDGGNMIKARGIGVRLDGRICNTMKAFELSEEGVKPGLTVVLERTQERILELIRYRREIESSDAFS